MAAGRDLGLKEVERIAEEISNLNPRAKIIFGISQNPKLGKKIKITSLAVGENFLKTEEKEKSSEKKEEEPPKKLKQKIGKVAKKEKKEKKTAEEKKKKIKVRRSALEVKKAEEEAREKEWLGEEDWEIPSFLRKKME